MRGGDEEQRHADHRGPEHPHLTEQEEVADRGRRHRARDEDVPRREDRHTSSSAIGASANQNNTARSTSAYPRRTRGRAG